MATLLLSSRNDLSENPKIQEQYEHFKSLIEELGTKSLPDRLIEHINLGIQQVNTSSPFELKRLIPKVEAKILKQVEKDSKIVAKGYYRNLWMALGMSVFGLPIGLLFGLAVGNIAFLAVGLPIGLGLGIVFGTSLDKKAEKEGRQLNWETKRF